MTERYTIRTNDNIIAPKLGNLHDVEKVLMLLCWLADTEDELQKYRQAEGEGRLVVLPCKVGDKMFSLRWNIKKEKYELYTSEIKNVRYDSHDGSVMVSDGERFRVWGKNGFATHKAAEAALAKEGGTK